MNGMDDIGDDDNFSDDGFEDLPANTLYELEQNAILSTQQAQQGLQRHAFPTTNAAIQQGPVSVSPAPLIDDDAAAARRPSNAVPQSNLVQSHAQTRPSSSDAYLIDDANLPTPAEENVSFLAQNVADEVSQRELHRVRRYGPNDHTRHRPPPQPYQRHQEARHTEPHKPGQRYQGTVENDVMLLDHESSAFATDNGDLPQALHSQLQQLLQERDRLTRDLQEAKSAVQTQRGEISIIRANQEKTSKTYDKQLATLKKAAEEEAARHRAEVEAARRESERVATENKFLKQDLTEESKRVKGLQQNLRTKAKDDPANSPISTPKKTKSLPHRDGFDDEDLRVLSPSRSARKSKKTTPVNNKRKRQQLDDSPIAPLVLESHEDAFGTVEGAQNDAHEKGTVQPVLARQQHPEEGLRFLQQVYNFHPREGEETLIEVLTGYSFPSDSKTKFSTIVIEESSFLRGDDLSVEFARIIVSMWSKSLKEKYYTPVSVFVDVIKFIISLDSVKTAPSLIIDLLPVLQASGKINGVPRFEHSPVSRSSQGKFKFTPKSSLNPEVNATECLELLVDIAYACMHNDDHIDQFWRTMDIEFVLIMLNSCQPISDMTLNLNLLSTSIRPKTFGKISALAEEQTTIERHVVERLTCLLWETPRADEGEPPYTPEQISEFRIEVMSLLSTLALSTFHPQENMDTHGSWLLAQHPAAIGRLVRSIYDEVAALYTPEPTRELHSILVNEGVRLFYRLLELHGNNINLHQKLQAVNGGVPKHAVVLTRLAFRDGPLMEEGINDETCVMAHEMLEQVITPEEAEALLDVFPTQKSRR